MMNTRAEAFAPATVANLGVGFDILGLALCEPGDIVQVMPCEEPGAHIIRIEGDNGKLPHEPEKNTACVAANSVLKLIHAQHGVGITVFKNLPLASGLGSSAASAVAAAVAVNKLFNEPLSMAELLPACLDGEAAVSGYHADNVAPSLFGGITLVWGTTPDTILQLPTPANLHLALVTPDVEVPTVLARSVLPKQIELHTMVIQTAAVARLIDALYREDLEALAAAMEGDRVVEPARAYLMPLLAEMRIVAKKAGALGLVISGAGPTLCAICADEKTAQSVSKALELAYSEADYGSTARYTQISNNGATARLLDD
ncbi:MAG: homoserine kinase [Chloroflexota bacterium]